MVKQSTDENIKTKVLELLQTWGMAFRSSPKYRIVTDTLNLMKQAYEQIRKKKTRHFPHAPQHEWVDLSECQDTVVGS